MVGAHTANAKQRNYDGSEFWIGGDDEDGVEPFKWDGTCWTATPRAPGKLEQIGVQDVVEDVDPDPSEEWQADEAEWKGEGGGDDTQKEE